MKTPPINVNKVIITTCEELIKSFNPVTHSIDTHCLERLGDVNLPDSKPENLLIQQIVYGWHKEKAVLKCFINDFYADNGSRVLRSDITLYTIFAYLAVFRLQELGFPKFKELALSQEPLKITTFINYVFNKDVLWNALRSSWMKVRDLAFVETKLIVDIEKFIPQMVRFTYELEENAVSIAAESAAKEEAKARGDVGLPKTTKKASTRPVSPRLTRPRPPIVPEPIRIEQNTTAHEVPSFLENTNLAKINKMRVDEREESRKQTQAKYSDDQKFKFHETKGGRSLDDVRREVDAQQTKDLAFDSSYVNHPPDFSKITAKVRLNASTIYREDALYRKQQAKDAAILKNYEDELRDPNEYYLWQKDLKERDAVEKLKQVALRREQAKQSSVEAKEAMSKQREDNYIVASMLREQAEVIKHQKALENEIKQLQNQEIVQAITEVRSTKPLEATKRATEDRVEKGKRVREELEAARLAKEEEDRQEELVKADKIRQLRALNEVHKKHIVVFDPTQTAGIGLLDEMSFMEMKERLKNEKLKEEEAEQLKRAEILDVKQKKAQDLERRSLSILRARQVKAEANQLTIQRLKNEKQKEAEDRERAREAAAIVLEQDLKERREAAKAEQAALKAEQEKIKRQQQYLGAALGQVEETREQQQMLAKEREINLQQSRARDKSIQEQESMQKDRANRSVVIKHEKRAKQSADLVREQENMFEKRVAVEKMKAAIVYKKTMFKEGQAQHAVTKNVLTETNPYAARMTEEIHTKTLANRAKMTSGLVR